MIKLRFDVTFAVRDRARLLQIATQQVAAAGERVDGMSLDKALFLVAVEPRRPPAETGFEIGPDTKVMPGAWQDSFRIEFDLIAHEPEAMIAEAIRRRQACWQETEWRPATLEEAGHEILVASNATDTPTALGLEIVEWNLVPAAMAGHAVGPEPA